MKWKRVVLWSGAATLLLAATVVALALLSTPQPFRFLDGRKPLPIKTDGHPFFVEPDRRFFLYCFRAEVPSLLKEARPELKAAGFKEEWNNLTHGFLNYKRPGRNGSWPDEVVFYKDTAHELIGQAEPFETQEVARKGWVTVTVDIGQVTETPWERIVRWLGL